MGKQKVQNKTLYLGQFMDDVVDIFHNKTHLLKAYQYGTVKELSVEEFKRAYGLTLKRDTKYALKMSLEEI